MNPAPASIPSPPIEWSFFEIGPFVFHVYALIIVVGMILAIWWTNRRMVARGAEPWALIDIAFPAVLLGLLGARLYHVATHPADYFFEGAELWRIFAIWEGGNAIIGSLIGGAIGAYIACRIKGIRFLSFADAAAPTILAAQAIGRLGNWFNQELFGWPTDLPWGLEIPASNPAVPSGLPADTLFHPTFLYELLWNLLGVALIIFLERCFRLRWGKTLALYLVWYGLGRMMIESIRLDYSEIILGLRSNVFGALVMVLIGVVLFVVQTRRHKLPETSVYADGHVWSERDEDEDASVEEETAPENADGEDAEAEETDDAEEAPATAEK
ncbi:prolipoprotein diacylglyceryl transferase [Gulosibacter sp. 10]|uniref:prolipoprotein diacylglyceryl transferase n=1 Tax=Gulosibacter sp. 10 TaxID=1255570 RepID=UPI00097EDCD0|nr:prolipoprotein diacylglyceryl transferase [Gulosibacter sp. 10]SJM53541.1 Prolipoprotein diacylglyceryl transferase [Gulosibacter sp. 10]